MNLIAMNFQLFCRSKGNEFLGETVGVSANIMRNFVVDLKTVVVLIVSIFLKLPTDVAGEVLEP